MAATATVLGGFWPQNSVSTLTQVSGRGSARRLAARALGQKGVMSLRELMETLDGVVAGSAASKALARVVASSELGGVRAIENETLISRNSAAGDVTTINADILTLSTRTYTASPVANGDHNPLGTR